MIGTLALETGTLTLQDAPHGRTSYGICTTPAGEVWWCSLAGPFVARTDRGRGASVIVEPPTRDQGARRFWSDRRGRLWVSERSSGNLSMHDPTAQTWRTWRLPPGIPNAASPYVASSYPPRLCSNGENP